MNRVNLGRMHRALRPLSGVLAACGLVMATMAAVAVANPPAPGVQARASVLPARTLRVALRQVPMAGATRPAVTAGPGSVVVGTAGGVDPGPVVTLRSRAAAREDTPTMQVLVANGEQARLTVRQDTQPSPWVLDALWVRATAGTGSARAGALLRPAPQLAIRQIDVLARWPGGAQPVQLWLSARAAPSPGGEPAQAGDVVETQVSIVLDRWVVLARSGAVGDAAVASGGHEWQLKVTLQPE